MPALKNRVPSYRLHKASGKAVVTLNGSDHYLGPHGSPESRTAYDRLIGERLANGRRDPQPPTSTVSVEELMAEFWQHVDRYYRRPDGSPTSEVDSYRQALKPVRARYGDTPVDQFGPLALKAIREEFVSRGYVRKSINQRIGRIKRMFKWGVENELVPPAVYQGLQAVSGLKQGRSEAGERGPVRCVPEGLVKAIEPHVSRQVWAMVQLQLLTGMRSGEVVIMRGCDLTMSGDVWEYRPAHHKTAHHGRDRVVPLGPKAQAIIREFLKPDLGGYLFSPKDAQRERAEAKRRQRKTPVTPSQAARQKKARPKRAPGDAYTNQSYGKAVAEGCKKAGVTHWTPHQLRHTAATRIRREHGLEAAQVVLGHSRADVTQLYAESNKDRATAVMRATG